MGYRLPYLLFWRHCYFLWHFFRNKKMKGHPLPCLSLPPSPPFHLSPLRSHYPACIWIAGERASKSMAAVSWPWVSFLTLRGTELLGAQNVFSIPVCTTSHSSSFREERTSPGRSCASDSVDKDPEPPLEQGGVSGGVFTWVLVRKNRGEWLGLNIRV